ncbi:hypothetical protein MMK25_24705 [Bacillus cereus]|nr:hypothetical protein [Bacillus cereus]
MSISVSDELQLFAQEVQSFLSPNILRNFARDYSKHQLLGNKFQERVLKMIKHFYKPAERLRNRFFSY